MPRILEVQGSTLFRITIPDTARVTFGPWSPPPRRGEGRTWSEEGRRGTLRVYDGKSEKTGNILAVYTNVIGFRDLSLGFAEQVAKEEGAVIWKDDEKGYVREDKMSRKHEWIGQLDAGEIETPIKKRLK